jgi:hypothetical protein
VGNWEHLILVAIVGAFNIMTQLNLSKTQTKAIKSLLKPQEGSLMANRSRSKSREKQPRSRSNSRGKGGGKKVNGAHLRSAHFRKNFVKSQIPKLKKIQTGLNAATKRFNLVQDGYFDTKDSKTGPTDVKDAQTSIELLKKELELAVGALKAGLGNKPIRMKLVASIVITTTVTPGVTNSVTIGGSSNQLNPAVCGEWATMALLFEEYKCLGGEVNFMYNNPSDNGGIGSPETSTTNVMPIMAYDADDLTAATSSIALAEAAQHKVLRPLVGSADAIVACPQEGIHHTFRWHVPRGTAVGGGTAVVPGTEWIDVSGVQTAGWLKFYHIGSVVAAIKTGAGFVYFDLEFRCRA